VLGPATQKNTPTAKTNPTNPSSLRNFIAHTGQHYWTCYVVRAPEGDNGVYLYNVSLKYNTDVSVYVLTGVKTKVPKTSKFHQHCTNTNSQEAPKSYLKASFFAVENLDHKHNIYVKGMTIYRKAN